MNDELCSIGGFKTEHRGLIDVKVCLPAFFLHLKDVNGLKNHITCRNLSMTEIDISIMTLKMKVFFYPFSCRVIDETHLNAYRAIDLGVFQTFTCYFIDLLALFLRQFDYTDSVYNRNEQTKFQCNDLFLSS